ncbi:transposase, partial [Eggerthella lenta]
MSKSQVSRLCECLDAEVDAFRRQRFDGVRFAYLWLDATYVKCRAEGRSASQAVVTAIGLDDTGHCWRQYIFHHFHQRIFANRANADTPDSPTRMRRFRRLGAVLLP